VKGIGKIKYDAKKLAEHYQISTKQVARIIFRGNTLGNTAPQKRPGRKAQAHAG